MNIGAFIKYYRIYKGMTQKQVGEGICTPGHISKIESGHLQITKDKIDLFNQRLHINIEKELKTYKKLQLDLELWHDVMIKQVNGKVELLKETIEQNPLIQIETLNGTYKILKARYFMMKGKLKDAGFYLSQFSNKRLSFHMSDYDFQLYYHIKGMYELEKGNPQSAVMFLGRIDRDIYSNPESYFHLSIGYHELGQYDRSLRYSQQALNYFKETFNFTRCIDAATIQLIAESKIGEEGLESIVEKYDELIQHCDNLHDHGRKAILYLNLGGLYRDLMQDRKARDAYQVAYGLLKHESPTEDYVRILFGYIESSMDVEGPVLEKWETLIEEGLRYATANKDSCKECLFTMLGIRVHEGEEAYYQYMENVIIPLLKEEGQYSECNYYIQKLYNGKMVKEKECVNS
ncbi:helix-turn-helix domain-containing protein [Rossellomorea vietnamensis]|uniref:helix-turn-helix domain-containing protein n=1 Tax=Rossellomorea vietnamensis TaxID=218284 RepID=UPI001CC94874|nr:helix-turn-helix transcriptional regulator [Rossellomorea vietnamensis]MCA0150672.1 helix-turn-helix domain-containing protein [Rossellomorea vietnamensis]